MQKKQQFASCECMGTAVVEVLFNLIPRSSNTDAWRWPPSWRAAPNIKPKLWYLSVSEPKTQQSAILQQSRIRHFADRCTYQQAVNQHVFRNVRFVGGEKKPWNFILQSERRASLFVHHFDKSIILWYYGIAFQLFIFLMHLGSFEYRTYMQRTVSCRLQLELVWLTDS